MSGRSMVVGARRATAIVATAALLAVAAVCAHLVVTTDVFAKTEFSGAAFRAAVAAHDAGAVQAQAQAAVDSGGLVGLSAANLKHTLGAPAEIKSHGSEYVWELGEVSGFLFGGQGTALLYVDFAADSRRVESAAVYRPSD
jgi:hypothetical protein